MTSPSRETQAMEHSARLVAIGHVLHDSTCPTCHDSMYKPRPVCDCSLVERSDALAAAILALLDAERARTVEDLWLLIDGARDQMKAESDAAYCSGIDMASDPRCLGWVAKMKADEFREAEYTAHRLMHERFGKHRGLMRAVSILRALRTGTDAKGEGT